MTPFTLSLWQSGHLPISNTGIKVENLTRIAGELAGNFEGSERVQVWDLDGKHSAFKGLDLWLTVD